MQIIRVIVAGEHDLVNLAQFRDSRWRSSHAEIAKVLRGHYQAEHSHVHRLHVDHLPNFGQFAKTKR